MAELRKPKIITDQSAVATELSTIPSISDKPAAAPPSSIGSAMNSVRSFMTPFAKSPALAATQAEGLVKKIRP